jgi:hypothetical protein
MSKITPLGSRGNNNGMVLFKVKTESVWKCSFAFTGSRINNLLNDTKIENSKLLCKSNWIIGTVYILILRMMGVYN